MNNFAILAYMKASLSAYDQYGERASHNNFQEMAGRYAFQKEAEQYVLFDILQKLSLIPKDDLLEIGCGAGNLLIPLSFFVNRATGIDHPSLLSKLRERVPEDSKGMTLLPGNFLDLETKGSFSRVLIYSLIQCLSDEDQVMTFITKAATLLRPGGKMLIGDLPNADKKTRFLASEKGAHFSAEWQKRIEVLGAENPPMSDVPAVVINDALVSGMISTLGERGMRAQRLPQPQGLPFSFTREDILVQKM